MSTISFDPSFLSSVIPFYSTSKFKIPAKTRLKPFSTVEFGAKTVKASSLTTTTTTADDDSNQNCNCGLYGRRGLIFMATLPFLLPLYESMEGFDVKAAESNTSEYLLIKDEVSKVLSKSKAAGVLRLAFHDAGTFEMDDNSGGMNGSLVYELDRPENAGLKKSLKTDQLLYDLLPANSSVDALLFRY